MLYENPTSHDLELLNGSLRLADGVGEEASQRVLARLLTVLGEWFMDTAFGLDYRGKIWDKRTPTQVRDAHIQRQALLGAGDGSSLTSYDASIDTVMRTLSVDLDVKIGTGEVVSISISTGV
jgi:hypothetical protein